LKVASGKLGDELHFVHELRLSAHELALRDMI
jgi:hypothetical protein